MSGLIWIQMFDTRMVFLKDFFFMKKLIKKKNSQTTKSMQNYPACKESRKMLDLYLEKSQIR